MKLTSAKLLQYVIYISTSFIALLVVVHLFKPEVDPAWQPISEYALGANGWVMKIAFLTIAVATLLFTIGVRPLFYTVGGKIGLLLLFLSSIGFFLAAVFDTDPAMASSAELTTHGNIHSIGAGIAGLLPFAALLFLVRFIRDDLWIPVRKVMIYATATLWLAELSLIICMAVFLPANNGQLGPDVPVGWPNRIQVVCCALWLIIVASNIKAMVYIKSGQIKIR